MSRPRELVSRSGAVLALAALVALQFVPNGGSLPWGGISMRLTPKDLPFVEEFANATAPRVYLASIRRELERQRPQLPRAEREKLVAERWEQAQRERTGIEALRDRIAERTSSHYLYEHDGRKYPYMPGVDEYLFLRHARNVVEHGDVCDDRRDGACVDEHRYAPRGYAQKPGATALPYAIAGLHELAGLVSPGIPLMQSAGYLPIVAVLLALVPAFFLGRRVGGNVGGLCAGTLVAVHASFLARTKWGHPDTDALNILLPLMSSWLFLEAFDARKPRRRIPLALGAGLVVGLFALTWEGWWYIFYFILAAGLAGLVLLAFVERAALARGAVALGLFVVTAMVATGVALGPVTALRAAEGPLRTIRALPQAAHAELWPNVFTSVAELQAFGLGETIDLFDPVLLAVAVVGIVLAAAIPQADGRRRPMDAILLAIWFVAALHLATRASRFSMFLLPPLAIATGAAFGIAADRLGRLAAARFSIAGRVTAAAALLFFALVTVLARVPVDADRVSRTEFHLVDDAWWRALSAVKRHSGPDAIVTTWWDFGHQISYIADRQVTFDAGGQDSPLAYWVGRLLVTDDEHLSLGILRMLDCGGNRAFEKVDQRFGDTAVSVAILEGIARLPLRQAREALLARGYTDSEAESVLSLTHCRPPESFLVVSGGLVRTAQAWGHFGSWDFVRAAVWRELVDREEKDAVAELSRRFGLSLREGTRLYAEAKTLSGESAADTWIAPKPGFLSTVAACGRGGDRILCGNGVNFEPGRGAVLVGSVPAQFVVVATAAGGLVRRPQAHGRPGLGVLLMRRGTTYRALLASPPLLASMFTRLFYLNGAGLPYELFLAERSANGDPLLVYRVRWPADGAAGARPYTPPVR